jgi:hypothetical protein
MFAPAATPLARRALTIPLLPLLAMTIPPLTRLAMNRLSLRAKRGNPRSQGPWIATSLTLLAMTIPSLARLAMTIPSLARRALTIPPLARLAMNRLSLRAKRGNP